MSGCTPKEIATLEARMGTVLPASYVYFLETVGRSPGDLLPGTHLDFGKLEFLQRDISRVMSESGATWRRDGFCFASNPSYVFLWFRLEHEDDPTVQLYEEGWTDSKAAVPSFSKWLEDCVWEQWGVRRSR